MVLLSLTVTVQAAECVVPSAPVICRITLEEPENQKDKVE